MVYLAPWVSPVTRTFTQGAFYQVSNTAAGGKIRIGLYSAHGATGMPYRLVAQTGDIPGDTSAPGTVVADLLTAVTILAGRVYWIAVWTSAGFIIGVTSNSTNRLGQTSLATGAYGDAAQRAATYGSYADPFVGPFSTIANIVPKVGLVIP